MKQWEYVSRLLPQSLRSSGQRAHMPQQHNITPQNSLSSGQELLCHLTFQHGILEPCFVWGFHLWPGLPDAGVQRVAVVEHVRLQRRAVVRRLKAASAQLAQRGRPGDLVHIPQNEQVPPPCLPQAPLKQLFPLPPLPSALF